MVALLAVGRSAVPPWCRVDAPVLPLLLTVVLQLLPVLEDQRLLLLCL